MRVEGEGFTIERELEAAKSFLHHYLNHKHMYFLGFRGLGLGVYLNHKSI